MKKLFYLLFVLCVPLSGACVSSGAKASPQTPVFTLDVSAFGDALFTDLDFRDQLEELDPLIVYTLLGIDGDHVAAQKNFFSSGATAEEILVFQAVDQEAMHALKKAIEARIEDQKRVYVSYAPEEVIYLKGAVLEERGDYLVYCVAADAVSARKMIEEALR